MRYIKSSFQYIKESKENTIIVEFSDKFKELNLVILETAKDPIAKYLSKTKILSDVTLVDCIDGKNDTVSFIQSNRFNKNITDLGEEEGRSVSKLKGRTELKIGRLIRKLIPEEFTPKDIETYVNLYKASFDGDVYQNYFSLVNGKELVKYYHKSKYHEQIGSLGNSCMKDADYLSLYELNPTIVSLLILKEPNTDSIIGRALIWKLTTPENMYFMDRVYTTDDYLVDSFKNYAKKKKWLYKNRQTYSDSSVFNPIKNEIENIEINVSVLPEYYPNYPYMDSLYYYYKTDGILSNTAKSQKEDKYGVHVPIIRTMRNTGGSAEGNKVYDDYRNKDIYREDACFCRHEGEWTNKQDAIWMEDVNSFVFPTSVAESKYHGKMVLKSKSFFVESIQDWVLKTELLSVFTDNGKTEYVFKDRIDEVVTDAFGYKRFKVDCESIIVGTTEVYFRKRDIVDCYEVDGCWFVNEDNIPTSMIGERTKVRMYKDMIEFGYANLTNYFKYRFEYLYKSEVGVEDYEYITLNNQYKMSTEYLKFLQNTDDEPSPLLYLALKRNNYIDVEMPNKNAYHDNESYIYVFKRYISRNYRKVNVKIIYDIIDEVLSKNASENYREFVEQCETQMSKSDESGLFSEWRYCLSTSVDAMDSYVRYVREKYNILQNLNDKFN